MRKIELEPCPFCGQNKARLVRVNAGELRYVRYEEELKDESIYSYIHCYHCNVDFSSDDIDGIKMVKIWNRRAK